MTLLLHRVTNKVQLELTPMSLFVMYLQDPTEPADEDIQTENEKETQAEEDAGDDFDDDEDDEDEPEE